MKNNINDLKKLAKQIRKDILTMIYTAKSGHPGGNLSAVEIIMVLYNEIMTICPKWKNDKNFEKRDRFVLSKGHASAVLYSVLAHLGYFPKEELLSFRSLCSRLQGHPSSRLLDGIEVSTGSLGQGVSMACGIALGLKLDKNPAKVYVYVGDGELQEGSVWEAFMHIAHRKLDNIVVIIDKNNLQIDGATEDIKSLGNLQEKLSAFGFEVLTVDGHDIEALVKTFEKTKKQTKPVAVIANTVKGKGVSFMENTTAWHGKAPNKEEFDLAIGEIDADR